MNCTSEIMYDENSGYLHVADVTPWITGLPDGAALDMIVRDFGSQRDPAPRLIGLRASWSEGR